MSKLNLPRLITFVVIICRTVWSLENATSEEEYTVACLPHQIKICGIDEPCKCSFGFGAFASKVDCNRALVDLESPSIDVCPSIQLRDKDVPLRQLFFRNNKLKYLQRDRIIPTYEEDVEVIDLNNNLIEKIDDFAFRKFVNLRTLALANNTLREINKDTFKGLQNLEELDLRGNNITYIRSFSFAHLKNLKSLLLDGNPVVQIGSQAFWGLSNLTLLSLDRARLSYVDQKWFRPLDSLQTLSLQRNNFHVVPQIKHSKLLYLYLNENPFSEIEPNSFSGLSGLEGLFIENMPNLWFIDDCAFCGLTHLDSIVISECRKLSKMSNKAFGSPTVVKSMKLVDFSNNSLTTLSEDMLPWQEIENVRLTLNPWRCDCRMQWVTNLNVNTWGPIICAEPLSVIGTEIHQLSEDLCNAYRHNGVSGRVKFLLAIGIIALVGCLLIAVWLTYSKVDKSTECHIKLLPINSSNGMYAYKNLARAETEQTDLSRNGSTA